MRVMRRKAVAFLVSDFLVEGGVQSFDKALRIAHRRHDVVPVTITDPLEEELPKLGLAFFEDLETGEVVCFDTSGPGAGRFAAETKRARDNSGWHTPDQSLKESRGDDRIDELSKGNSHIGEHKSEKVIKDAWDRLTKT